MARKKDLNYFDVLTTASCYAYQTACQLNEMISNYHDVAQKAKAIHDLEHAADYECHRLFEALNIAFITPIDREDIYDLIKSIDDITDLLEDVANRFYMFNIAAVRPEAIKFCVLMENATQRLYELLQSFKNHKKNQATVHRLVKEVNTLEEEGDCLYRDLVKELFLKEKDVMEVIKWKEIFDDMENVLDACEDVADIIQGVVMKNN
ncbi:MAG TPA: DUF47 domain-containing protein [Clostridiales bacterium]|nr:DUF47 domain-containing protein [Clostridiales bacterium]